MVRLSKFMTAAAIVIACSEGVVLLRNRELRDQLQSANNTIRGLTAGSFHPGDSAPVLKQDLAITVLDADNPRQEGDVGAKAQVDRSSRCTNCTTPNASGGARRQNVFEATDVFHNPYISDAVTGMTLNDLKTRYLPNEPERAFTLFIFFSPVDCAACLKEAASWQALYQEGPLLHLSVVGIVDRSSVKEATEMRRDLGITFPVLFDTNSVLVPSFGILRTPEKIVVDKGNNVIFTSPANQTGENQQAFERDVRDICARRQSLGTLQNANRKGGE